jgi:uncharacterized membrane protein YccC
MTTFRTRLNHQIRQRGPQFILALRITASVLLALALSLAVGLPLPLWSVLTALILTQASLGGSLRATFDYMIGTLGGAIYGGAIAVLIPHTNELSLLVVMALAVAPLALLAAINPRMSVAPVTAVIVLLLPAITHVSPLESAINRVIEVGLGALTGLVVSVLLFPSKAHHQAIEAAARTLTLMASVLENLFAETRRGRDVEALHRIQDGLGKSLMRLDAIAAEAAHERSVRLATEPETGPLLRTLMRLRHDLVIIGRATAMPLPHTLQERLGPPLAHTAQAFSTYMRGCSTALLTRGNPPPLHPVRVALEAYNLEMADARHAGSTRGLTADAAEHFFALGFALEQIQQNFKDLERCVAEWSQISAPPTDLNRST